MNIILLTLSFIFLVISVIHFLWALGSQWNFEKVIPIKENGERLFTPRKIDCAVVGLGLLAIALFYLLQSDLFDISLPNWVLKYGGLCIPLIFLLRAMGDFRYAGFFKKIKNSPFAEWDSKLFSPLCLLIAILGVIVSTV